MKQQLGGGIAAGMGLVALMLATLPAVGLAQTTPEPLPTSATPTPTVTSAPPDVPATATASPTALPAPSSTPVPESTAAPTAAATATPTPFSSGVPCAVDDPSSPHSVQRSERYGSDDEDEWLKRYTAQGRNEVVLHNCTDGRLRLQASIQLDTIHGNRVEPVNLAYAEGSCTDCQTLAVALQIALYKPKPADDVQPQNYALALNTGCMRCTTVALAYQYAEPVDQPEQVRKEISDAVDGLDAELRAIIADPTITLPEAERRIEAVIARFRTLGGSLSELRDRRDD